MIYKTDERPEAIAAVASISSCADTNLLPQTKDLNLLMSGHLVMKYLTQNNSELAAGLVVCYYLNDMWDGFTLGGDNNHGYGLVEQLMRDFPEGQELLRAWCRVSYRLKTHEMFGVIVGELDGKKLGWLIDHLYGFRSLEVGELYELHQMATERHNWALMC